MFTNLRMLTLYAFFLSHFLYGEILETPHFKEILNHIRPNSLIVLDIDDTLLIPCQTLGTDVWFIDRYRSLENEGLSRAGALNQAILEWLAIRHITEVKIVEEGSQQVIRDLQNRGVHLMGLTTQGLELAPCTSHQLKTLGIDLSRTAPGSSKDIYFSTDNHSLTLQQGVLYRNGIIFSSGTPKGPALAKVLSESGFHPEHVIFINDKHTHLVDVETTIEQLNIPFTGLRYSYSDERIKNYNPAIAKIQFENSSFNRLMSDDQAHEILLQQTANQ